MKNFNKFFDGTENRLKKYLVSATLFGEIFTKEIFGRTRFVKIANIFLVKISPSKVFTYLMKSSSQEIIIFPFLVNVVKWTVLR